MLKWLFSLTLLFTIPLVLGAVPDSRQPVVVQQSNVVLQPVITPSYTFQFTGPSHDSETVERFSKANSPEELALPAPEVESSVSVDNRTLLILKNNCAQCHTGPGAKKKIQLFNSRGEINKDIDKWHVLYVVDKGNMPPARPLVRSDRDLIEDWARQGLRKPIK